MRDVEYVTPRSDVAGRYCRRARMFDALNDGRTSD